MHSLCMCYASIIEMNSTDQLDLNSRQKRQIDVSVRDKLDSTVQIISVRTCSTCTRIACMNVCVLYIALASFIHTQAKRMCELRSAILVRESNTHLLKY